MTRADCRDAARPCLRVSCRHHLLIHLRKKGAPVLHGDQRALMPSAPAEIVRNWIDDAVERLFELADTCALDVADRGKLGPKAIGRKLGVTKVRVDQVNGEAEPKLRAGLAAVGIDREATR